MNLEQAIKQSVFKDERHKFVINLFYTSSWLETLHQKKMRQFGLTLQQYNILRILRGQKGNPLSINDLIDRMIDKNSNASRLVDKLVEKGHVSRVTAKHDRRQVEITLTPQASELLERMEGPITSLSENIIGITQEEAKIVNDILDKLRFGYPKYK